MKQAIIAADLPSKKNAEAALAKTRTKSKGRQAGKTFSQLNASQKDQLLEDMALKLGLLKEES